MATGGPHKSPDTILGSSFKTIDSAMKQLDRHRVDPAHYQLVVLHHSSSPTVVLAPKPNAPAAASKNLGVQENRELTAHEIKLALSTPDEDTPRETLDGAYFHAIVAAAKVFTSKGLNLQEYQLQVVREAKSVVVIFTHKDRKPGTRGHVPGQPGYEVELDLDRLEVLRSNYVR